MLLELEPLLLPDAARAVVKGDPRSLLAAYVVLPDQRGLLDCLLNAHSTAPAAAQPFAWSGQHVAALGIRPVWTRPADRVVARQPISDSLPHSAYQRPRTAGDADHARTAPETARRGTSALGVNAMARAVSTVLEATRHAPGTCVLLRFADPPAAPPARPGAADAGQQLPPPLPGGPQLVRVLPAPSLGQGGQGSGAGPLTDFSARTRSLARMDQGSTSGQGSGQGSGAGGDGGGDGGGGGGGDGGGGGGGARDAAAKPSPRLAAWVSTIAEDDDEAAAEAEAQAEAQP